MRPLSISTCDPRPDLFAPAAVDKLFEGNAHRFGTTCNNTSLHELIDRGCKVVCYSGHKLSHAESIRNCNAYRNAPQSRTWQSVPLRYSGGTNVTASTLGHFGPSGSWLYVVFLVSQAT